MPETEIRNVVIVIMRDSSGNYYANKRAASKKLYPGYYGLGAGGRLDGDEEPEVGAKRELKEETDLDLDVKFLYKYQYELEDVDGNTGVVSQYIFEATYDGDVPIKNEGEWVWCGWVPEEVIDLLAEQGKLAGDTAATYFRYKDYLQKQGA